MASTKTSVFRNLNDIKAEVESNRQLQLTELKKGSKKELSDLPETLSQKERVDYLHKVQPHFDQIYKLASLGYKKATIAEVLGITQVAFRKLCREVPELRAVLEIANEDKLDTVEESLYQLATGYEVEETIISPFDGSKETITTYKAPVLGAIKYILSNKRGEEYADKKQIVKKIEIGSDIRDALMSITVDDLRMAISMSDAKESAIDADFSEKDSDNGSTEEEA